MMQLVDMDEYNWLRWFVSNADFGPASGDVWVYMIQRYEAETGERVPDNWREGYIFDEEEK